MNGETETLPPLDLLATIRAQAKYQTQMQSAVAALPAPRAVNRNFFVCQQAHLRRETGLGSPVAKLNLHESSMVRPRHDLAKLPMAPSRMPRDEAVSHRIVLASDTRYQMKAIAGGVSAIAMSSAVL